MSTLVDRKLTDLRVVELKNELEKRGLDKTGVKALLVSRLQEALVSEGRNPNVYTFKVVEDGPRKSARKSRDDTEKTPEEEEEEEEVTMEANDCFYEGSEEAEYRADSDAPDDLAAAGVTYGSSADGSERTGGDYDEEETIEDEEESHLTSGRYEGRSQENYSVLDYGSEENLDSVELNDSSVECPVAETAVCEDVNKASSAGGESKKDEGGVGSSSGGNAEAQGTVLKGTEKAACTGSSLWVTGIPPKSRAADVKELVGKYGRVHLAKIVTCANAPGSKCFAFVTMFTPEEADKCVQELNHTEMNGKRIVVERAKSDRLVTSKLHSAVKKSGTGQTVVVKKAATQPAGGAPSQTPSAATTAATSATSTESGQEASSCKETSAANATTAVGENGKDSKREEQSSKEVRRAGEWGSGDIDGGRSKEKKRSTSRTHDGRYRRRSRSRTRSRSSGRHHRGREEFGGGFRMHTPMRGMGFRRPLGRGGYPMRRPMRGPYPPRYPGSSGSRFYDDRRDVEYEKMRMREKEYMQREEMLRIEREKARLRADRERLEREKLELQQQRMRMGYDGGPGGGMAGSGGMKRMYDTNPYPPTKRVAYATAPGGYDTRMPPSRDRVSTGYRRPEYPEGREVRRPPADRYEYRGDRYGGGAGRTGGGDHRSGPRMAGIGGSTRGGGASGAMGRSDGRRMSPPSSMPRRGRPSAAWESGGSGGRSGGGYGAHSSGGGGGPGGWMDSVDRGSAGAGGGGGGGWNRGPNAGGSTWGTGCFGSGGSGGGDGQYGSGERFDNYGNGKYSGSINRRY